MTVRALKALVPWRAKVAAKIVLARLPFGYGLWRRLQLFRHGAMTDVAYAERVFESHLAELRRIGGASSPTVMELGPGDSLLSALLGRRAGVARTILVDTGRYAVEDPAFYRQAAVRLGLEAPDWPTVEAMLSGCAASYLVAGLDSLRNLPDASVDLIWSQAVLEHVRLADLDATIAELRRVLRPGGLMSHEVDFRDHLGGSLNSLRFTPERWEGALFSGSGFYTNRVRMAEMVDRFVRAGFRVECRTRTQWEVLPTARTAMDPCFASLGEDDLRTSVAHLVMYPS